MDEITAKLCLQGDEKEQTIKKIEAVVASWGLTLPAVDPEPLHFGYNDFMRIGETEYNINNNVKEGYCGKFMFMFKGQTCPQHHHAIKHETFFIVKGSVEMTNGEDTFVMQQGDTYEIDQYSIHTFTAREDSLILESSKPDIVTDSIFVDDAINKITGIA
jgi:mannose-6-phosphate isomerase-like protein (cupin superfamily)